MHVICTIRVAYSNAPLHFETIVDNSSYRVCMDLPGQSKQEYKCALCQKEVGQRRLRKVLTCEGAGREYFGQLIHFCEVVHPGYDIEEAIQCLSQCKKYICKVCQDEVNKWERLHTEIESLQQKISEKVDILCGPGAELPSSLTVKRPPALPPTTLAPKRLKLPAGTSPEVQISCMYTVYAWLCRHTLADACMPAKHAILVQIILNNIIPPNKCIQTG